MTTVAMIQARMSSTRFPGKSLAHLRGEPLILHVCRRTRACSSVDEVVVVTSNDPSDDELADVVARSGFDVYRGSLHDVLDRYVEAARSWNAGVVVRITGDCPLVDPELLTAMLSFFREEDDCDYLSNVSPPTFPDGLDIEIMAVSALEAAAREATDLHDREHVTPFIRQRPERFRLRNYVYEGTDLSDLHWSVDEHEHLELVEDLIEATGCPDPELNDLLEALRADPELERRSYATRPNEGSVRSFVAGLQERWPPPRIVESEKWWSRANGLVPAGTQTFSKGPTQYIRGFAPMYLARGQGSHVWDVDGGEYIDYPMGLGPVTLGHANSEVIAAVTRQLAQGTALSLMHPLEVELAERLRSIVPCCDMVRFGKNGSDATAACVRAARAITGRVHVARCGYHGWQDWAIDESYGIRTRGVPAEVMALTHSFPYNDLGALEHLLQIHECASVIMEPVATTPPAAGYLEGVRELATQYGAVLIFDEVITGFRYARGGAQEYFGVVPDMAAMGKGVANGLPLSLVLGKAEFMEVFEDIFFSFTFAGETSALAAAMATLDVMEREDYWSHVWRLGGLLQASFRSMAHDFGLEAIADCEGLPPWTIITFRDTNRWTAFEIKTLFQQEMLRRGVLFSGSQFISLAHSDKDIEHTISAYRGAFQTLRFALDTHSVDVLTQGSVNEPVFRRA